MSPRCSPCSRKTTAFLKKSSLFYATMMLSGMIAELLGGVVTDYLLRRTRSVQIARSLQLAVVWSLAVAALVPAILIHDLAGGLHLNLVLHGDGRGATV